MWVYLIVHEIMLKRKINVIYFRKKSDLVYFLIDILFSSRHRTTYLKKYFLTRWCRCRRATREHSSGSARSGPPRRPPAKPGPSKRCTGWPPETNVISFEGIWKCGEKPKLKELITKSWFSVEWKLHIGIITTFRIEEALLLIHRGLREIIFYGLFDWTF